MGSNRPHRHTLLVGIPITTWVATLSCPIVCVFLLCVLFMHKPTTHHHAVGSNIDNITNVHLFFSNVYNHTLSPSHPRTQSPVPHFALTVPAYRTTYVPVVKATLGLLATPLSIACARSTLVGRMRGVVY